MSKTEIQEDSHPKGLLGSLLGILRNDEPGEQPSEPEERPPDEPPEEQGPSTDPCFEIPPDSGLYQLWRKWAPESTPPPLSLGTGEDGAPLAGREVEREKNRVREALEREAQRRLRTLAGLPAKTDPETGEGIPPKMDAQCFFYVAQNGMAAWCFLYPPIGGGEGQDLEDFGKTMQASHITSGIDAQAVTELLSRRRYFELRLIAIGTPVVEGEDGSILERYPRQRPQSVQMDETGRVDYRAQSYVQGVGKGDVICDVIPPTPGTDGLRVDGKPVKPKAVKPARLPKGSNTALSEDGAHLIATMEGNLEYAGSVFQVKPTLDIAGDIDYSTGNIDFRGDVHIRGDVRENFTVRATGTITIDGLVEAATLEAGGDIIVANGILGDNKALIKSRGTVRARYLENCVVFSGACTIADCIMASRIYSDDCVYVTGGRGTIIGGGVTAARRIEAQIIGSKSGRETEITLGVLPYVQEEKQDNEADLEAMRKELEELDRQLSYLESQQGIAGSSAQLAKSRLRRSVLALKADKLTHRQEELEEMQPDLSQCRLECGTVFPITRLSIGPDMRVIEQLWTKCAAVYDMENREIKFV